MLIVGAFTASSGSRTMRFAASLGRSNSLRHALSVLLTSAPGFASPRGLEDRHTHIHTCIQTDVLTYIHTYIHTYRHTDKRKHFNNRYHTLPYRTPPRRLFSPFVVHPVYQPTFSFVEPELRRIPSWPVRRTSHENHKSSLCGRFENLQ